MPGAVLGLKGGGLNSGLETLKNPVLVELTFNEETDSKQQQRTSPGGMYYGESKARKGQGEL